MGLAAMLGSIGERNVSNAGAPVKRENAYLAFELLKITAVLAAVKMTIKSSVQKFSALFIIG